MRTLPAHRQPHILGTTVAAASTDGDTVMLLRCDEASAGNGMTDAAGGGTFTDVGTVGVSVGVWSESAKGARNFDGSTQYQHRASSSDERLIARTDTFSVAAWIRPDVLNATQTIISLGDAGASQNFLVMLQVTSSGQIGFFWQNSGGDVSGNTTGISLSTTEFQHVCLVRRPAAGLDELLCDVEIWLNGALFESFTDVELPQSGASSVWAVGANYNPSGGINADFFNGDIDDVIVNNFSASEEWVRESFSRFTRQWSIEEVIFGTVDAVPTTASGPMPSIAVFSRVRLQDAAGDFIDMSSLNGWDFVRGIEINDDIDAQGQTATVRLSARNHLNNLSPFVAKADLSYNPVNTGGAALLEGGRRIKIDISVSPPGASRELIDDDKAWWLIFDGFVQTVSVAGDEVNITCIDKIGALQTTWIEPGTVNGKDRIYGTSAGTAVEGELQDIIDDNDPAFFDLLEIDDDGGGNAVKVDVFGNTSTLGAGRPFALDVADIFRIDGTSGYDGIYTVATTAITHAITSETTGGGVGSEVETGTMTTALGYRGGKPTLWVPTSPAWAVYEWSQPSTGSVIQALEDIMDQIGWRVCYRWDENRQEYRLKVHNPAASPQTTTLLSNRDLREVRGQARRIDDVRNTIVAEYGNRSVQDNVGTDLRFVEGSVDVDSVATFGRLYSRVGIGAVNLIKSSGEALELTDRMLADLKDPTAETTAECRFRPDIEPGDNVEFYEAGMQPTYFTDNGGSPNILGVKSVSHRISKDEASTTIVTRGAAAVARVEKHFDLIQSGGAIPGDGTLGPRIPNVVTGTTPLQSGTQRGVFAFWGLPTGDITNQWSAMEVHIDTSSGFTPSSSTLFGVTYGTAMNIWGLTAATTYYLVIIPRDRMNNTGNTSPEATFATAA